MSGADKSTQSRTQLLNSVQEWRRSLVKSGIPRAHPSPLDDLAYQDDDGEIIYTVVLKHEHSEMVCDSSSAYRTRSLADAIARLSDSRLVADPEIRVGGMPVLSASDLRDMENKRQPVNMLFPIADLNSITASDARRFNGRNTEIRSIFGAKLDPIYNPKNNEEEYGNDTDYYIGDVPIDHQMASILAAASRNGASAQQSRRLEDFAVFASLAGSTASKEDVSKAWERTQRSGPTQEELDAAWAARKAEIAQEIKSFVVNTTANARQFGTQVGSLARTVMSSLWEGLKERQSAGAQSHAQPGPAPFDVAPYASAILDHANVKGAWRDFPDYMNAYQRGEMTGDTLSFRETLPVNSADILIPVRSPSQENDASPLGWMTQYPLKGADVLDAMNEVVKRGGRTLINDGRLIDIARMGEASQKLSSFGQGKTSDPQQARAVGKALFDLLQTVGGDAEKTLLDRYKIDGAQLADVKTDILVGFEDAMHEARGNGSARITSLMMEIDRRIALAVPESQATVTPVEPTVASENVSGPIVDDAAPSVPPEPQEAVSEPKSEATDTDKSPAKNQGVSLSDLMVGGEDHDEDHGEPMDLVDDDMGMSIS